MSNTCAVRSINFVICDIVISFCLVIGALLKTAHGRHRVDIPPFIATASFALKTSKAASIELKDIPVVLGVTVDLCAISCTDSISAVNCENRRTFQCVQCPNAIFRHF